MSVKLAVEGLYKTIDKRVVLNNISFEVKAGETISVIGPNGAGKSTLLKCIDLLIVPDSGRILLDGVDITSDLREANKIRTRIGFVFQEAYLFSHMRVLDNVMLGPLRVKKMPVVEAKRAAAEALELVGLGEEKWAKFPMQLSGGERQRAAIARALAMQPELILYDEPTSNLDPIGAFEVFDTIRRLSRTGVTNVIATHDTGVIFGISRKAMLLVNGRVIAYADPREILAGGDEIGDPLAKRFVASLISSLNGYKEG